MKALMMKDFLVITKQLKLFLLIIPIMAIIGGASIVPITILLGAAIPMTAIAYDEQSKWNELAVMMPYSKKNIVLSKYLLGYICIAGAAILFIIAQLIIAIIGYGDIGQNLFMLYFSILSGLFLIAVNTPIMFKFGTQKGRFVFIAFMGLIAACGSIINNLYTEIPLNLAESVPMLLFVLAVMINVASVRISLQIKHT